MAGLSKTVSKAEALRYDPNALRMDIDKRKHNIHIFEDAIVKEKQRVDQNTYIISQIDPSHPDVKTLRENNEKIMLNINTFEEAISEEKKQIDINNEMIRLITN